MQPSTRSVKTCGGRLGTTWWGSPWLPGPCCPQWESPSPPPSQVSPVAVQVMYSRCHVYLSVFCHMHAHTFKCTLLFRPILQPLTLSMPDIMFELYLLPCSGYCLAPLQPSTANSLQESVLLGTCSRMDSHKSAMPPSSPCKWDLL